MRQPYLYTHIKDLHFANLLMGLNYLILCLNTSSFILKKAGLCGYFKRPTVRVGDHVLDSRQTVAVQLFTSVHNITEQQGFNSLITHLSSMERSLRRVLGDVWDSL